MIRKEWLIHTTVDTFTPCNLTFNICNTEPPHCDFYTCCTYTFTHTVYNSSSLAKQPGLTLRWCHIPLWRSWTGSRGPRLWWRCSRCWARRPGPQTPAPRLREVNDEDIRRLKWALPLTLSVHSNSHSYIQQSLPEWKSNRLAVHTEALSNPLPLG